jgi:5-methylcytosine-specific restriction enzyme A
MRKLTDPFYLSPQWRALRLAVLRRDGYCCVICGINVSGKGEARVDHIRRVKDGGAPLNPANLRTLCVLHEQQSHREKGTGSAQRDERFVITGCNPSGKPLDPSHPWNR